MKLKHLLPADYPAFKRYFSYQRYRLCTYSLSSIIAWQNDNYQPYGAVFDNSLVIAADFKKTSERRHLILPISPDEEHPPAVLCRLADTLGYGEFWFVPECYLDTYGRPAVEACFRIERHQGYDDYIYRTQDLAQLTGNRYSKKRNLINQFEREYVAAGRVAFSPIAAEAVEECLEFLEKWCEEHDCDADKDDDLFCEKQAAISTLLNLQTFEVSGLLMRVDGRVSAFGIAAYLTAEMATLQYEKAFSDIKGLYQYFDRECARRLFNGYVFINKESDMGQAGLAKAKKSYCPVDLVKSYRLIMR
jgi:uncharacterized protein